MASDSNNHCDSVNNIYIILKFKKVKVKFPCACHEGTWGRRGIGPNILNLGHGTGREINPGTH
jgi:hypothetical protein